MGPGSCHRRRNVARRGSAALLGVTVAFGVSACGDDEPTAESSDTSSAESETASATPTKQVAEPLSEFEGQAPVKAARKWGELLGRAVNQGDQAMQTTAPRATSRAMSVASEFAADDLAQGYRWPGPQPFTPVAVRKTGDKATLTTCFQTGGWSIDQKKGTPVRGRKIEAADIELVKVRGQWKVDNFSAGVADCAGVTVRGVKW